jgi:hypothetical protein
MTRGALVIHGIFQPNCKPNFQLSAPLNHFLHKNFEGMRGGK